jgi:hypothetical protein
MKHSQASRKIEKYDYGRAYLDNKKTIPAVRFEVGPVPDKIHSI